ncbi:uncharacterized protein AKAME5_001322000 [Lates japonicus]|uniref:Cilia- and flagella-associated protein 157 n=1 Tax=Lates japonicus TaxID=270547 RepID=A0AAD3RAU2_LATJO|nr:uncharacterized protein AKAME5_001322000 [Lates japonicus]
MADVFGSEDNEKSLYLVQIQYLEGQLERCQLRCDELEKQHNDLMSRYSRLEKDKKDVTEHLKRSVAAKQKKVEEVVEQLESQKQAAAQDREALQLQHNQQMQELQEQVDELNLQIKMQATKFEEQKEQLMQLGQRVPEAESLEKQLVSQKEEHDAVIHGLRMDAVLERERAVEDTHMMVEIYVEQGVSEILQMERAQHRERLEQVQSLLSENEALQREKSVLLDRQRELLDKRDELKDEFNKAEQESFIRKKEVKQLREKHQQLTAELKDWSTTQQNILAQIKSLRQHLASVSKECCQKTAEADRLQTELQKERSRSRQLDSVKQEAAIILRHILKGPQKSAGTQWKMERLLEIVESTAPRGTASAPDDPAEKSSRGHKPQTSGPKPARKLCSETTSSSVDPSEASTSAD